MIEYLHCRVGFIGINGTATSSAPGLHLSFQHRIQICGCSPAEPKKGAGYIIGSCVMEAYVGGVLKWSYPKMDDL